MDYKALKYVQGSPVIKVPSEVLGAPRQTVIDSVLGIGVERRVAVGEVDLLFPIGPGQLSIRVHASKVCRIANSVQL